MFPEAGGRDWKLRAEDIILCIEKIQAYTSEMNFEQFESDPKTIDAVIRNFEIIGEAASHIPEDIQERYPNLGWFEMRGMRNLMIHEYFGVSLPIIWHTIQHDLDPLLDGMQRLLSQA